MLEIFHKNKKDKELKELENFKVGSWVNVEDPSEEELDFVCDEIGLEKSLLKDSLDQSEVPRMEIEDNVTYIFTRVPSPEKDVITVPILIAVSDSYLITLSSKKLTLLDEFKKERKNFYTTQKTKFLIQIFSAINNDYNKKLTNINRSVRGTKIRLEKIKNEDIIQLVNFEEVINDYLSALIPTNAILQKLLTGGYLKLYEEDKDLVEDLFLANGQLVETSKSTLKNIVNIRGAYSSIMTHDLNRVIKLLTALTIILTVPTIIASLYGMNVSLPYQDSPMAFLGIILSTAIISFFLYLVFKKNKWF
ncbi:MAG: magnesium transporter CorA family protein [Candidatus Paceibacterota bacterium]